MSIKNRILVYGLAGLCLFLAVQWTFLWIKGIEWSPVQSLYRTKPKPQVIEPQEPRMDENIVRLPCVPLSVIKSSADQPDALQAQFHTLGRWDIPYSRRGGVAEVDVDKDTGAPKLTFTAKDVGLAELGRSRYLTLWAGYKGEVTDVSLKGYTLKLEYEQDLFRLGPLWTRGKASAGYEKMEGNGIQQDGFVGEVSLGIGIAL